MKKTHFFFLLLILGNLSSFGQWTRISKFSTPSVYCSYGHPIYLNEFKFLTPSCSFYWLFNKNNCQVHTNSLIGRLYSIDSCKHWNGVFDGGGSGDPYNNLEPANDYFEDTIFNSQGTTFQQSFYRSTDCGNTWNGFMSIAAQFIAPSMISVYNGRNGYGCNYSNGRFYRIDNDTCYQINNYNSPTHFILFKFFSDSIGLAASVDFIMRTSDGGNSWQTVFVDTSNEFYNWYFLNDSVGFIYKRNNSFNAENIYQTRNGGITWQNFTSVPNFYFFSMSNNGEDTLYSVYNPLYNYYLDSNFTCFLMRSYDGGATWDSIPFFHGYYLESIKMFTNNFGYVLARNLVAEKFHIFQTNTGVIGIDELSINDINFFPNPFTNRFTVEGKQGELMQLFDCTGKIVFSDIFKDTGEHTFNLNLPDGIYFLRMTNSSGSKSMKIIRTGF